MNTKFFKYIIPALSLVFSVNFTSCLGDLDVTPIDPNHYCPKKFSQT